MEVSSKNRNALRRVGIVLIAIGVIYSLICLMTYYVNIPFDSVGSNFAAIIIGALMWRGNLRAANIVLGICVFWATFLFLNILVENIILPTFDATPLSLQILFLLGSSISKISVLFLLVWIIYELHRSAIWNDILIENKKRKFRLPFEWAPTIRNNMIVVGIVVAMAAMFYGSMVVTTWQGKYNARAKREALRQVKGHLASAKDYQYYVAWITANSRQGGIEVRGVVNVYDGVALQGWPVQWVEN
jgi:hypothetical protein